ncbi:PepSY-like domain-containing protein [Chryseobacterium sp.]|uniref:PepSY-like domain-containing protein n=1 Tax=Chryseobacterium sp. TaxID=1871047 RepID=UPI0025BCA962|nr:PepSY-like domain-containing protein [Chryseobacterium sp.]
MKKLITALAFSLIGLVSVSCNDDDNDRTIRPDQLPATTKTFLNTYFENESIARVEKNVPAEYDGTVYEVDMTNGYEADFSEDGTWLSVSQENDYGSIPTGFIDTKIIQYISQNYPNVNVNSIDKEPSHIEVELTNNIDLIFNLNGDFVSIDY